MTSASPEPAVTEEKDPWPALFALCLGFFMILVDSTIVSVATPAITSSGRLPAAVADGFSSAMATSMLLPAAVLGLGLIAALLFERPRHKGFSGAGAVPADAGPAAATTAS